MPPKGNPARKRAYRPQQSYDTFMQAFARPIPTWHLLRQYENRFLQLENRFTPEQVFNIMNQFSRHEAHLTQTTGIGPRPTEEQIQQQHQQHVTQLERRKTRRMEVPEEAPFDAPEGHGTVRPKRKAEEVDLTFDEDDDLTFDEEEYYLLGDYFKPPSPPGGPPPPPPPSGGAVFI